MAHNFLRSGRDQAFLLPPDLRDWLPDDHLAWFVRDVVDQLDLAPFYRAHRDDGHGHPAYDPKTLLGVLLYAYQPDWKTDRLGMVWPCFHTGAASPQGPLRLSRNPRILDSPSREDGVQPQAASGGSRVTLWPRRSSWPTSRLV
jgi:hypothetical protein